MRRGSDRAGEHGECANPYTVRLESGRVLKIRRKGRTCCDSCQELWAGDQRNRLLANLIDGHGRDVAMVTLTAPGREVFTHRDGIVDRDQAYHWNTAAPRQFSQLHRRVQRHLERTYGRRATLLAYVWAYQRRGLLHLHAAFDAGDQVSKQLARAYVAALKVGLAHEWGFGFSDLQMAHAGSRGVASYFAKYVCKEGATGRPELAETVSHEDVPRRPIYVSNRLTSTTRCTMRNLRLRRYYWRARSTRRAGVCECWYVEDMWQRGIRVQAGKLIRTAHEP